MYDLVIKNALICDGGGGEPYPGTLAVQEGRIAAVQGQEAPALRGPEELDAGGLALAPGIVDVHTHYDAQITWDPYISPSLSLGVTTAIMGNCGFTIAPCRPEHRELTLRNLTQVEGMSLDALLSGVRWEFETFAEYLDTLERLGTAANVGVFCGHSALRTWVMGEEAARRQAREEEVQAMRGLLADALAAGAVGFASSEFEGHNGAGGRPMPSRLASESELRALVGLLGERQQGLYMLTKGGRTQMAFLESLAAQTQRPVVVAALQYDHANPERVFADLDAITKAQERGAPLHGQVGCTPITMDFTLTGAYPFESLSAWRPAIPLYGKPQQLGALYADPAFRQAVKEELVRPGSLNRFTDQWQLMEVVEVAHPQHAPYRLQNVASLARQAGQHPLDWLLDFGAAEGFQTQFTTQVLNSDEDQVARLLRHPHSHIALSDAGAHLSLFCDAGFGLHLLGHWCRERGDFTLGQAVHQLSARPAALFGVQQRGRLQAGYWADLLLFSPKSVGRGAKQRVHDLPSGALRLITPPLGVHGVWVNGQRVVDAQGQVIANGARPGHILRF